MAARATARFSKSAEKGELPHGKRAGIGADSMPLFARARGAFICARARCGGVIAIQVRAEPPAAPTSARARGARGR